MAFPEFRLPGKFRNDAKDAGPLEGASFRTHRLRRLKVLRRCCRTPLFWAALALWVLPQTLMAALRVRTTGCGAEDVLVCTGLALAVWVGATAVGGEAAAAPVCATGGGVSRTDFVRASLRFRCSQAFNETATIPAKQSSRTEANRAGTLKSPLPRYRGD